MNRIFKTLLLWFLIASLPLSGLAAVDASCARVSHATPSAGLHQKLESAGHTGNVVDATASSDSQHCVNKEAKQRDLQVKGAGCGGAACFTGAVAPPLRLAPTALDTVSEAVNLLPIESFTGYIPDGIDRPPRHVRT